MGSSPGLDLLRLGLPGLPSRGGCWTNSWVPAARMPARWSSSEPRSNRWFMRAARLPAPWWGPTERQVIRARLTVAADGLRSTVTRRLRLRAHGRLRRVALVAHVRGVSDLGESAEMRVGAEGYVGLNRVEYDLANVALVVPASVAVNARGRLADFFFERLERFPAVRGRVSPHGLAGSVLATGPFAARSRRAIGDGVLLVGDAAEFFDPFTGEGICSALRGAEMVAEHAPRALAHTRRRARGTASGLHSRSVARVRRQVGGGTADRPRHGLAGFVRSGGRAAWTQRGHGAHLHRRDREFSPGPPSPQPGLSRADGALIVPEVDDAQFRQLLGRFATGVVSSP